MSGREIKMRYLRSTFAFLWALLGFGVCVCMRDQSRTQKGPCDELPPQDRELILKREEEFSDPRGTVQRAEGERELSHKARGRQPTAGETQDGDPGKGQQKDGQSVTKVKITLSLSLWPCHTSQEALMQPLPPTVQRAPSWIL